jgi:hypothetical protein
MSAAVQSAADQLPGLAEVDPAAHPPLALYQSPWTVSLAVAFIFRGAGTYAIDDIDNAGVVRGQQHEPRMRAVRKEVMSRKGWTNCRPLSAFCPDGLFFANLARADYATLARSVPLAALARHQDTTVERLIRDSSTRHGLWSLAGPDRAIAATPTRDALPGLREIIAKHEEAVCRTLPREIDREAALKRLRHLMPDPAGARSLLGYFQECLRRGLALVGSDTPVVSAAFDLIQPDGGRLLPRFVERDEQAIAVYNEAARIQASRPIGPDHPLPYYTVRLDNGDRADLAADPRDPASVAHLDAAEGPRIIAPKILVLEGATAMALPRNTASRATILAREHAYRGLQSGSSQVFFEADWLESLTACDTEVNVDGIFQPFVGARGRAPLRDVAGALIEADTGFALPQPAAEQPALDDLGGLWRSWVLNETLHDLRTWHYPALVYAIAGDAWLERLSLRSYTAYGPGDEAGVPVRHAQATGAPAGL